MDVSLSHSAPQTPALRLPNFLIIGAQKCGTTWLHEQFASCPDISLNPKKETHFFIKKPNPTEAEFQVYLESYTTSTSLLLGEATPTYFTSPPTPETEPFRPTGVGTFNVEAAKTIRERLGAEMKLIVSVRDPVKRAVSAFFHHVNMGRVEPGQTLTDLGNYGGIVYQGFFGQHLRYWLEHFPRENFYITSTNEIREKPEALLGEITTFLGVPAFDPPKNAASPIHEGLRKLWTEEGVVAEGRKDSPRVTPKELAWLEELYAEDRVEFNRLAGKHLL